MKKVLTTLNLALSLLLSVNALAQTTAPEQKMSVNERLEKARAAKAEKRTAINGRQPGSSPSQPTIKEVKATSADYQAPVDKSQKGPNGEVVRTGERGGKFYINKNGNKTYLSSNQ